MYILSNWVTNGLDYKKVAYNWPTFR